MSCREADRSGRPAGETRRYTDLSLLLTFLILATAAEQADGAPLPDGVAEAVLKSSSYSEAARRLTTLGVESPARALPTLFSAAVSDGETDDYWGALCKLDSWSDGAWWAEIMEASYNATDGHFMTFANRYLEGDDCALLLLQYSVGFPEAIMALVGPDCSPKGKADFDSFDARLASVQSLLYQVKGSPAQRVRSEILDNAISNSLSGWELTKRARKAACGD